MFFTQWRGLLAWLWCLTKPSLIIGPVKFFKGCLSNKIKLFCSQKSSKKGSFDMALLVKEAASLQLHVFCTQNWDLQSFCSAILSAQMKSNYNKIMYINSCTMQIERALLQSGKWWLISYYSVLSIYPTQWLGGNCRSFCTLYLLYVHCKWASFTRKDLAKLLYHDIFTLWKNIHYSKIKIHGVWHQSFLTMSLCIYSQFDFIVEKGHFT